MLKPSRSSKMETIHHENKDHKAYFEVESSIPNAKHKTIVESESEAGRNISELEGESEEDQGVRSYQLVRDREKRVIRPYELDTNEPKTYSEAVNKDDLEKWRVAMDEEMQSLIKITLGF